MADTASGKPPQALGDCPARIPGASPQAFVRVPTVGNHHRRLSIPHCSKREIEREKGRERAEREGERERGGRRERGGEDRQIDRERRGGGGEEREKGEGETNRQTDTERHSQRQRASEKEIASILLGIPHRHLSVLV